MAILAFQKPDKVLMLEADNHFGKFEFKPLEPGYGITIGNALRRILLSSLEGFAISSIREYLASRKEIVIGSSILFPSQRGEEMTRQGLWKILPFKCLEHCMPDVSRGMLSIVLI